MQESRVGERPQITFMQLYAGAISIHVDIRFRGVYRKFIIMIITFACLKFKKTENSFMTTFTSLSLRENKFGNKVHFYSPGLQILIISRIRPYLK